MYRTHIIAAVTASAFLLSPALALAGGSIASTNGSVAMTGAVSAVHATAPTTVAPGVRKAGIQAAPSTDDQIANLQRTVDQQNAQINALRTRIDSLGAQLVTTNATAASQMTQIRTLSTQLSGLGAAFAGHTHNISGALDSALVTPCHLNVGQGQTTRPSCTPGQNAANEWVNAAVLRSGGMTSPPITH